MMSLLIKKVGEAALVYPYRCGKAETPGAPINIGKESLK
jgi:hypothetical protein